MNKTRSEQASGMNLTIDLHKLSRMFSVAHDVVQSDDLRREGRVFFIGANLPVYSTLETMYESYCQDSSELFHVTFGDSEKFEQNLEMVRQVKRNFSIRLMGRIGYHLSESQVERVYLAGLDMLDIPNSSIESDRDVGDRRSALPAIFKTATATFTRWSVVSSIPAGQDTPQAAHDTIMELLRNGIVPLLDFTRKRDHWDEEKVCSSYRFLATEWHRYRVPLKPIMPLLKLTTPFVFADTAGYLRNVINKLDDRRILATSDLRRHLRTRGAEASFESAGL